MFYYTIKNIHVTAVALSFFGFVLRGWWMLGANPLLHHKVARTLPHIVDSVLLLSAIGLSVMISQYPLTATWLTAKFVGLLGYIVLGMIALGRGPNRFVRVFAGLGAMLVYVWIVSVAMGKQPMGFLALW